MSANAGLLPERVEKAAQERIVAGIYQTLVFGVVNGDSSEAVAFGKLDDGTAPDGDTVYETGSITKTFTATLLAEAVLARRVTLDTPVAQLLPDFKIPSRGGKEITLGGLATQHSGLPRMPSNFQPKDLANPYADYDAARLKAFLGAFELRRDPDVSPRSLDQHPSCSMIAGLRNGAAPHRVPGRAFRRNEAEKSHQLMRGRKATYIANLCNEGDRDKE
jgi:serine-type D-Ala-D-Ala carboxypeptidase/endopeptidase